MTKATKATKAAKPAKAARPKGVGTSAQRVKKAHAEKRERATAKREKEKGNTLDAFVSVKKTKKNADADVDSDGGDDLNGAEELELTSMLIREGKLAASGLKPYVGGIDIGYQHLGFCVFSREPGAKNPIFIEQTTLLRTADGRIYADYKEKINHELCYNWIYDRWGRFFSKMSLLAIEKQMIGSHVQWHRQGGQGTTKAITQKERACITIETAMKSIFWTERARGGPAVYVVRAQDWKQKAGIEIGNHSTTNLYESRLQNKERADVMFRKWIARGNPFAVRVNELTNEKTTTDMCDAFFTAYYAFSQYNKLMVRSSITSNHVAHFSMKKVVHADRVRPLLTLGSASPEPGNAGNTGNTDQTGQ